MNRNKAILAFFCTLILSLFVLGPSNTEIDPPEKNIVKSSVSSEVTRLSSLTPSLPPIVLSDLPFEDSAEKINLGSSLWSTRPSLFFEHFSKEGSQAPLLWVVWHDLLTQEAINFVSYIPSTPVPWTTLQRPYNPNPMQRTSSVSPFQPLHLDRFESSGPAPIDSSPQSPQPTPTTASWYGRWTEYLHRKKPEIERTLTIVAGFIGTLAMLIRLHLELQYKNFRFKLGLEPVNVFKKML
jgi:hypothetical protein